MAIRIRRRELLAALGGAVAWPLDARAQQSSTKIARVGIIDDAPIWDHFRRALRELGYNEGRNITFEYRVAGGQPDRLATAASDLVDLPVDIIVVYGSAATRAARQATATIPIVMTAIGDPVGAGFVQNLAQPGGNITGSTLLSTEMTPKRVELLKELVPNISRVAFLWNSNNPSHLVYLDAWRSAAPRLGIEPQFFQVSSFDQFEPTFRAMMRERCDALSVTADPVHLSHIDWIIDFVLKNKLPTIYISRENAAAGGLMSYGPNLADLFRRAATYVQKILKGTRPADLPVEQPIKFDLVINLKTAKALGLNVPQRLLYTADEVIE